MPWRKFIWCDIKGVPKGMCWNDGLAFVQILRIISAISVISDLIYWSSTPLQTYSNRNRLTDRQRDREDWPNWYRTLLFIYQHCCSGFCLKLKLNSLSESIKIWVQVHLDLVCLSCKYGYGYEFAQEIICCYIGEKLQLYS